MWTTNSFGIIAASLLWTPLSSPLQSPRIKGPIRTCRSNSFWGKHQHQLQQPPSSFAQSHYPSRHRRQSIGDGWYGNSCLFARPEYTEKNKGNDEIDFILSSSKKRSSRRRKAANSNANQQRNKGPSFSSTTMSTAICIVPPDDAWDTIQRARHLARDTSFYRWPPAIRLFHPFAPRADVPSLVGRLAEWIEDEMGGDGGEMNEYASGDDTKIVDAEEGSEMPTANGQSASLPKSAYLQSFPVTLSSIQILPHFEVLDARIEALEQRQQRTFLDESMADMESRQRRAEGLRLIEDEERKGLERKRERERKRRLKKERERAKLEGKAGKTVNGSQQSNLDNYNDDDMKDQKQNNHGNGNTSDDDKDEMQSNNNQKKDSFNGPCVIYLSPDDESRARLEALRETLRAELFPEYNAFSPSSSVSPYPERLPRKARQSSAEAASQFRPLLPIARFATVDDAIKVAKVLQQTWDPLTFNVTDIQFISRGDENDSLGHRRSDPSLTISNGNSRSTSGVGFGNTPGAHLDMDIPEVRHRRKHGTLSSPQPNNNHHTTTSTSSAADPQRMAITTSGEVEDISRQGIYGCDAMVMLWGEEPEEEIMDEEASLSMIMDDDDDDGEGDEDIDSEDVEAMRANGYVEKVVNKENNIEDNSDSTTNTGGKINYDQIFATAEREYQRMQAHEELSTASYVGGVPIFDSSVTDIEAWLDDDEDGGMEDEGATVVIGRAQFFMGAMREFIGMPASSAIDSKDRIMAGGVSAVARRKGSVHRMAESWDVGDYGKKDSDRRP